MDCNDLTDAAQRIVNQLPPSDGHGAVRVNLDDDMMHRQAARLRFGHGELFVLVPTRCRLGGPARRDGFGGRCLRCGIPGTSGLPGGRSTGQFMNLLAESLGGRQLATLAVSANHLGKEIRSRKSDLCHGSLSGGPVQRQRVFELVCQFA